ENATRDLSQGGGSSELKTKKDYFPLDEIKALYGDKVIYAQGYQSGETDFSTEHKVADNIQKKLYDEAIEKAKQADLIIFIGGLNKNKHQDCEESDRKSYDLSFGQNELITALAGIQKNIIVVTNGGSAFHAPWADKIQAFLHVWYLGSMGGRAMANILSGKVCPSGKLPISWAKEYTDYYFTQFGPEAYPGVNKQVYYKDDIYVGYRHFNTHNVKPLFPFGHGLSYTTFAYSKPQISAKSMKPSDKLTLTFNITNTGKCDGKETVQLYIGDPKCSVSRPTKELKAFKKIALNAGETKAVTFEITDDMLKFWSEKDHAFIAEEGTFKAYICASETDIKGIAEFKLQSFD
ncbi:MAG: glycoside hydrolase family 3 C-terminal domain-containing protein, partial [Bacteroidaceae bacterium]|nr:glycoside hydrolase family 3 C-terminal domain-containing protein [Bacteroidaceae bacterium]